MTSLIMKQFSILVFCAFVVMTTSSPVDDIDRDLTSVSTLKILRAMTNQTKQDSLNLPANATSIRENITDNFSCENRTYGYYADVENDCQIFHVCLPSQTTSGRNITYKWSFICPNETIFNQEVLVCTRPRDSIPCEEAEMYYDVNDEFGKTNETKEDDKNNKEQINNNNSKEQDKDQMKPNDPNKQTETMPNNNKEMNNNRNKNERRKPSRKQKFIENDTKKEKLQTMESYDIGIENNEEKDRNMQKPEMEDVKEVLLPVMVDAVIESEPSSFEDTAEIPIKDMIDSARIVAERSLRWKKKDRRESRRRSLI